MWTGRFRAITVFYIVATSIRKVSCEEDFYYISFPDEFPDSHDHQELILRRVLERNIKFYLYSRLKIKGHEIRRNDGNSLRTSGFNATLPTKLIIHGYMNTYHSDAIQLPKTAYLAAGDYNVIAVDWSEYTFPYVAGVNNARPVGHIIGNFVTFLMRRASLLARDLHIIGHSLGAHVASFSVEKMPEKPARITGLDPAAPIFSEQPTTERLDSGDARFVDVIHTSIRLLGMIQNIGHVDFYPAGGQYQPRCPPDLIEEVIGTCDHSEAYVYFSQSILQRNLFKGVKCHSLENALNMRCRRGSIAFMGEDAINRAIEGIYYVDIRLLRTSQQFTEEGDSK